MLNASLLVSILVRNILYTTLIPPPPSYIEIPFKKPNASIFVDFVRRDECVILLVDVNVSHKNKFLIFSSNII